MNIDLKRKFDSYPNEAKKLLLDIRTVIFDTAEHDGVGRIAETLKWGEPSYLAKNGSAVRIDWKPKSPDKVSADPDRDAVLSYIAGSTILVCLDNGEFVSVAVLMEKDEIVELKNIAVLAEHQGKGIAKQMISEGKRLAKQFGAKVMEVGTGNSSLSQLALYQKCGFRMHSIDSDYFKSYPEPIFENGIRCIDMVRLRIAL